MQPYKRKFQKEENTTDLTPKGKWKRALEGAVRMEAKKEIIDNVKEIDRDIEIAIVTTRKHIDDPLEAAQWFLAKNEHLGGITPQEMVLRGRIEEVLIQLNREYCKYGHGDDYYSQSYYCEED